MDHKRVQSEHDMTKGGSEPMNDRERMMITNRRTRGESIRAIASTLGLNANTVKSFCKRNAIQPAQPEGLSSSKTSRPVLCEHCGAKLHHTPNAKPKRFCCDQCRIAWWNAERKHKPENFDGAAYVCEHCGTLIFSRKERKYCSHTCYIEHRFGKRSERAKRREETW